MSASAAIDPARETLLEILRQLNQAEEDNDGKTADQALELLELQERLKEFEPVKRGSIKVSLALGLLLRNGLVSTEADGDYSWQRQREVAQRYRITAEGKKFLIDAIENSNRIG
jgi:hypothetical protein